KSPSASSGSTVARASPGDTGRGSRPPRPAPSKVPSRPQPISTASTRRLPAAAARESAAATALLPTPPLPVTTTSRCEERGSRAGTAPHTGAARGESISAPLGTIRLQHRDRDGTHVRLGNTGGLRTG